ncbi:hypothetical protein HOE425_190003 [Hoeflea sp. EC-HK425]|nr:hypothetical protein HOE425_190003 [Hoeflea sp. EC-HK425]
MDPPQQQPGVLAPGCCCQPYAISRLGRPAMCSTWKAASLLSITANGSDVGLPPAAVGPRQGILSYLHLKTKRDEVPPTSNNSFQFTLSRFRTPISRFKTRNRRFSRKRRLR